MDYSTARNILQDGDIVMVKSSHSVYNLLTKLFTGKYTHTGIVVWLDGGLWMAELNTGKNHVIPLSQLENIRFDVYKCPQNVDRVLVRKNILESVRISTPYGYLSAVITAINEFTDLNRFIHWRKIITCSGFVISILDKSGWIGYSYTVSPTKLSQSLKLLLEVNND